MIFIQIQILSKYYIMGLLTLWAATMSLTVSRSPYTGSDSLRLGDTLAIHDRKGPRRDLVCVSVRKTSE